MRSRNQALAQGGDVWSTDHIRLVLRPTSTVVPTRPYLPPTQVGGVSENRSYMVSGPDFSDPLCARTWLRKPTLEVHEEKLMFTVLVEQL